MAPSSYPEVIGIDVGKFEVVLHQHGTTTCTTYPNKPSGFQRLWATHGPTLQTGLTVLETTGGYEMALTEFLIAQGATVHRANTRHVHAFIRSWGTWAKTDALDACALARYGVERQAHLQPYAPRTAHTKQLVQVAARRTTVLQMLTQEQNRLQAPESAGIQDSIRAVMATLQAQLTALEAQLDALTAADPVWQRRAQLLASIPGIGPRTAMQLLIHLPELGTLDRKQIASLAGVAPHAYDSGTRRGYRRVRGGRPVVKRALFMAALAAVRSHSRLGVYYRRRVDEGKPKMVALVALMRKLVIIANAVIREDTCFPQHS